MATTGPPLKCGHKVGTSAEVGQGTQPKVWVLYSTDDVSEPTPVWQDASDLVLGFDSAHGSESELTEVGAGVATITLDNRERTFDPVHNPLIRPMNRWWIREQFTGETQDIFKGYAESYDQTWPGTGVGRAEAVVSCSDEHTVLARSRLATTSPPRDSYEDVVMFDTPSGYWTFDDVTLNGVVGAQLVPHPAYTIANLTPIVGDEPGVPADGTLSGSLNLTPTQAVSTGYRAADQHGGTGDFRGLAEIAIEVWWRADDSTPAAATFITAGAVCAVGRQHQFFVNTTGTISFIVSNGAANTTFNGTTVLASNTWYHLVATITGGNMRVYINGVQEPTPTAFASTIGAISNVSLEPFTRLGDPASAGITMNIGHAAVYPHGLSAARVLAHYQAGALRGFLSGQKAGVRIGTVLDAAANTAPRNVQAGVAPRTCQGTMMRGQDPLTEIRAAVQVESDDALFFISRSGVVTFYQQDTMSAMGILATFDDDGTDLPYLDLDVDYNLSFLKNIWHVTRRNGLTQTASDATSLSKYDQWPEQLSDLLVQNDAMAGDIATDMLARYKEPRLRPVSMTLTTDLPDVAEAAFRRDVGDKIRIFRTPPGGGTRTDIVAFIRKVQTTAAGVPWTIRWTLSPF